MAGAHPITVALGIPPDQHKAAATLYCWALTAKVTPFLGPPDRAAAFLADSIVPDRAITAARDGVVVGIAGFKYDGCGLFRPGFGQFLRRFPVTGLVRAAGLSLLERAEAPHGLLMDGLAVHDSARGQGIGTALLDAVEAHATKLAKAYVRLDVIDTNPNARRLYERQGYRPVQTIGVGALRLVLPFCNVTELRKPIGPPADMAPTPAPSETQAKGS